MITLQEMMRRLSQFWESQGCIIHQGYDLEMGAGTMNPATFLRCLGPEPYRAAYIEPCRRPSDGRYGENPNRTQHYFQYQVILKPSPIEMQDLYLQSLKAIGIDLAKHDIRFVHDDWENPTIGAWGLGWEVWIDGMEITQYTYFQTVGGIAVKPVTGELTYGIERLGMYLQRIDSIFDLKWTKELTYRDIYYRNEVEWSRYNFEEADTDMWFSHFSDYEREASRLIKKNLPIPAYDFVMKASHGFNLLDARGAISVTERAAYIARIRELAGRIAKSFIRSREEAGYPLIDLFPSVDHKDALVAPIPESLLKAGPAEKEDFLLEIGSEQLPAAFVPIGQKNLEIDIARLLQKENLSYTSLIAWATPRRIAILIKGLAMGISPTQEKRRGPGVETAFDKEGNVTRAGAGFFKSLGKEPVNFSEVKTGNDPQIMIEEINGKDYLFATVHKEGKSTAQRLAKQLPALILNLDFPKKMRWADLDISYARPIRWLVALFGSEVVPFQVGKVITGNISRGHSQLGPGRITIPHAKEYAAVLEEHRVLVCPKRRRQSILAQLEELENDMRARVAERDRVLRQVVNLVEWPQLAKASFDSEYLEVPKEVLISEMVEHQKYFPVIDQDGHLKNQFVITADTVPTEEVCKGNRKVLSSRLADGVFLYEKGLRITFNEYNKKLHNVTFINGLGTLWDKVKRLMKHAENLQEKLKISTKENAVRAAELSKTDLVTEMVFEFPELQGTIGRYYALHHKEKPEVAKAIEEQWMPRGENAPLPETDTGVVLSIADKLDNLLCCFLAGFRPTSSSDPHGLRRQVLGIIKMLIKKKLRLPFRETLKCCCRNFKPEQLKNENDLIQEIEAFFINRIKTVFQDYGFAKNEIEASLARGFSDIYDTFCRVDALHRFRQKGEAFQQLYEVYKRARGQINDQSKKKLSEALFVQSEEKELAQSLKNTKERLNCAIQAQNYDEAYHLVAMLQQPLARLFEEVRILADDLTIRDNRIALLQHVFALFEELLDFRQIKE